MPRLTLIALPLVLVVASWPIDAQKKDMKQPLSPPDVYKYAGLDPKKAAEAMTVPPGFTVKLFAGEPDVCQPIAFCFDDRGRLWVAEAYSYPVRRADKDAKDRILIFEDTDGDGHFDKRTVFMEGLNLVSAIEYGFGGIWIGAAPYLMFVPIKEGEDKPAGPPQILLDGWGLQDTHETLNTFTWGPDGWLYGCHGVFTHSQVGKPGTPDKDRVKINAGVWRYHPTRHVFEVFAHGTSNPWGLDFDEHGQMFITACVIPHNFHIIQGGRYHRQANQHFNPHTYADIPTIAEHRHWIGATPHDGNGRSDSAGGGHAHCGAMIYQGGNWPKEYHGKLFMGNIHGHRLNVDKLAPKGSGFVATREPDFLLANDACAMFINMRYGPDGNVYLIDWYDKQACHDNNPMKWDRSTGRIYKICYKDAKPVVGVDLSKKADAELVDLQLNPNDWYARHSRRILQERYTGETSKLQEGKNPDRAKNLLDTKQKLFAIAVQQKKQSIRLRALWTVACIDSFSYVEVIPLTGGWLELHAPVNDSPNVRAWLMQLMTAARDGGTVSLEELLRFTANEDPSPIVRLYIASALQNVPLGDRWKTLENLLARAEDANDHNLPLMYWYAAEPLAEKEPAKALDLAFAAKVPPLPRFMARRVASSATPEHIEMVVSRVANAKDETLQLAILRGMQDGLKGRRKLAMPASWPKAYSLAANGTNTEIRGVATALSVTFGDAKAFGALREVINNSQASLGERREALDALVAAGDKELVPVLHRLVADKQLRGNALRGLASFDDVGTPAAILAVYGSLPAAEKRDALNTLASRPTYGKALLDAVAAKKVASNDLSADLLRQLRNLNDKGLNDRIAEVWGIVRTTPVERIKLIAEWKKYLSAPAMTNPSLGRSIFNKSCQQCHVLFGEGGSVGPDITGANRASLDYLLENILDPSAVIPKEYTSTVIELKNGRVVTGIIREETAAALTVLTVNETLTIARDDVDRVTPSNVSMMPDDLLNGLSKEEVRALIVYLQSPAQVSLIDGKK